MLYKWAAEREGKARTKICVSVALKGFVTRPLCYWCDVPLTFSGDMLYKRAAKRAVKARTKICVSVALKGF